MTTDPAASDVPRELRLQPDPVRARAWAALALALLALTLWITQLTGGAAWAWVGVGLAVAVAVYFLIPAVKPELTTVVLDDRGIHGRAYHAELDARWETVQVARVVEVAGEPILELHVREPSRTGDPWRTRAIGLLLPLGCDLAALHRFLESRLGRR